MRPHSGAGSIATAIRAATYTEIQENDVLTITDRAVSTIRTLTEQPDLPDGTGLRIAADQASGALNVSLRTGPAEDDEVLAFDETLVFLEHMAAEQLDDKTMDADIDADGQVRFTIADQMP